MDNGNYFNQSYYQNMPNNEVNWAQLAHSWVNQNRPNPEHMQWSQPFNRPPGPPFHGPQHGGPQRFFNNQPHPPAFNNQYPPHRPYLPPHPYQQRMDYPPYNAPQYPPYPRPPSRPMGRLPSLMDQQWGSDFLPPPPRHNMFPREPHPPAPPLFPSAANTQQAQKQPHEHDPYNWPEQAYPVQAPPPPPPPSSSWADSNGTKIGDFPFLDTNERKQLPAWIREGLEQMEKEKKSREEKEERRKLQEAAERSREEARKAKGKSKFDSDSEEEEAEKEPVRRKFEEYPDRRPFLTEDEKEHIMNDTVKQLLIELLLESTKKLLTNCAENAMAFVKPKQKAKVVVNKNTAALAALASLGGSSSEEEDNDDGPSESINNVESGEPKFENQKAFEGYSNDSLNKSKRRSRSRSRSPHQSRSRSQSKEHSRYHSSRDDSDEDSRHHDRRRFSEGTKAISRHRN